MGDDDPSSQVQSPSFQRDASMERISSQPEDQSAMTIEFLRARLLAERSASKTARQRARHLALKVSELEQRVASETSMRRKLEEIRKEVLSKHKGELMEDYGYLFADRDDHENSQQESLAHSDCKSDNPEGLPSSTEIVNPSEEHMSSLHLQGKHGNEEDQNDIDQLASEKGILAWASRKSNQRLLVKEWALSPIHLKRSFSPRSLGSVSPDSDSPRKRWIGKSVRQIPSRTFKLSLDHGEGKHDQAKDSLHSDHDKDVEKMLVHQTELNEKCQAEESTQRFSEEEFQEHSCLKDDLRRHKTNLPSGARHEEDDIVHIASDERVTEDESRDRKMESANVGDVIKDHGAEVNESRNGSYNDAICSAFELAEANSEDNTIVLDVVIINNHMSEDLSPEDVEIEKKESTIVTSVSIKKEDGYNMSCGDRREEQGEGDVTITSISPKSARNELADGPSNVETPIFHLLEENHLIFEGQLDTDKARQSCSQISPGLNFYASSLSSSQGSSSALDTLPYQKKDPFSGYVNNHQEFSEGMPRDSKEKAFNDQSYNFLKSPSLTMDSDKPSKSGSYQENRRRSSCNALLNETSSCGSSKGLKNSSWDEIFKRRIRAQEAGNVKEQTNDAHSRLPPSFDDDQRASPLVHHFLERNQKAAEIFRDSSRTANYAHYSSPHTSNAHEQKSHRSIHRKSVDAGLDRVMEVLRALQIAKQHVECSNEHMRNEFRYPLHGLPYGNGDYPGYSPARRTEPFMYEMEDSHGGAYVQRAPFGSMQYGWMRSEPMTGEANWRGSHGYPPYTGPYK
ncbi:hypothetical protein GOP47_0001763 [Adiantum capillus-veneris]|uniref:Uncharacterized protein n=1 Tax=Adiantum capillus-veneris TaxID=13818 RepID=A0A9D4V8V8_ADICA|nr:hypothetical protein GOP47_0001763 [Adiantum capillus-veneris]